MVKIDIYSFVKELEGHEPKMSFARLKKELSELEHHHLDIEHIHSSGFFSGSSMHIDNSSLIRISSLMHETAKMHEATKNLNILASSIDMLRTMQGLGRSSEEVGFIRNMLSNEEYGINKSVESINGIGIALDRMESIKDGIAKDCPIDIKSSIEHEFAQKHGTLKRVHHRQKKVLLGLSRMFLELARGKIRETEG